MTAETAAPSRASARDAETPPAGVGAGARADAGPELDPAKARKARLNALLKAWGRAGARASAASSACGALQYALYIGFAFGAAKALSAYAAGEPAFVWLAMAAGFALLRAGAQAAENRLGFEAAARVKADVRARAARGLSARGPAFAERTDAGETASALIDAVEKLEGYYGRYKPLMPVVALGPLAIMIAAFSASWVAGALFLVTAPLLPLFMAVVGAGAAKASRDQMTVLRRLAGRFNDRLQALETLNAFNAAPREAEGLKRAAEDFRKRTMKVLALAFLSSAILEFFAALSVAAIAIYVGFQLLGEMPFDTGETVTLMTGVFVLILAPEFYLPLRRLSAAYHDKADAEAAAEALAPLFETPEGAGFDAAGSAPALARAPQVRFDGAGSVYADGRRGLAPIRFTAEAGRVTALWGPSGAGKSTALKLLMGYAPLSEGRVLLDGTPLAAPLIGQAAWIAQRPRLFHGTLKDNITLFDPAISEARVRAAAEAAGVVDFADALPEGLDTEVGERGYGLSGGQAQRVALARAIAADMRLLLLDEPTAHLDGEAEQRFLDALARAAEGRTVILATHSAAARAAADAVVDIAELTRSAA